MLSIKQICKLNKIAICCLLLSLFHITAHYCSLICRTPLFSHDFLYSGTVLWLLFDFFTLLLLEKSCMNITVSYFRLWNPLIEKKSYSTMNESCPNIDFNYFSSISVHPIRLAIPHLNGWRNKSNHFMHAPGLCSLVLFWRSSALFTYVLTCLKYEKSVRFFFFNQILVRYFLIFNLLK